MTVRRTVLILLALIVVAGAALMLLLPRATEVQVLAVQRAEATRSLAVNGRIRPRQSVNVQPPVGGVLLDLPHDVGDRVALGTILARIDDGPQRAAIAQATAAVAAQQAVLAQARRDYDRFAALGQFVTRRQLEEARLAVQQGAQELERLRASRSEAVEVQRRLVVRAPFSGVILERPVDRGQTVAPDTVIYRLADLTSPEVTADVDEAYAAELQVGTPGLVEVAGQPRPLRVAVVHIEPRVDEATGAREVRLRFIDAPDFAPAGETVSVELIVERRPNAISVPRSAILNPESRPFVRVVGNDGLVAERAITFIEWPAAEVVVTGGLEPGMHVILDPTAVGVGDRVKLAE